MRRSLVCGALFAVLALGCGKKGAPTSGDGPAPAEAPPPKPDPEPAPEPKPPSKVDIPAGAIEITSDALAKAYRADERAADAKYKGKPLLISGALGARFQIDAQHTALLSGGVTCVIKPGSENGVGTAQRGQDVRLVGRCNGGAGTIAVLDCAVLEVKPADFITVTADALFADFAKDAKAAAKKYSGPASSGPAYLHVTDARVTKIEEGKIDLTGPTTKGAKLQLRVSYLSEDAKPFAGVKIGDRISVKGHSYFHSENQLLIDWATIAP
jgi:hypothetical protein